ncbi:hypothetical protein CAP50_12115 [Psychrobacter sp. L7]|nr:hypothetical protein BTV99_11415 [Psychrobacter sp. Rd 27.2]PJX20593.1 hypothetical protein CAP50_12115 [Psychrobacter sp. L7]
MATLVLKSCKYYLLGSAVGFLFVARMTVIFGFMSPMRPECLIETFAHKNHLKPSPILYLKSTF